MDETPQTVDKGWYWYDAEFKRKIRRRGVDVIDRAAPAYLRNTRQQIGWVLDPASNNGYELLVRNYQVAETDPLDD